jgi:hypothetical protein
MSRTITHAGRSFEQSAAPKNARTGRGAHHVDTSALPPKNVTPQKKYILAKKTFCALGLIPHETSMRCAAASGKYPNLYDAPTGIVVVRRWLRAVSLN